VQNTSIWTPSGYNSEVGKVRKAVSEYDPNLDFGRNDKTGQWCIFLKHGTNAITAEGDLPVLGFREIPHPDDALRRLHQTDARRKGNEILDSINRHNENIRQGYEDKANNAGGQLAEVLQYINEHDMDEPLKYSKTYMGIKKKGR
jgi:hypothetical protein